MVSSIALSLRYFRLPDERVALFSLCVWAGDRCVCVGAGEVITRAVYRRNRKSCGNNKIMTSTVN